MTERAHPFLRPKRLCVCGGISISTAEIRFCRALGKVLAEFQDVILVSGGAASRDPARMTADEAVMQEAANGIKPDLLKARIETWLPQHDVKKLKRFEIGTVKTIERKGLQGRRFAMINSVDAVLAIGGGEATPEMVELALSLDKPCLPVPFGRSESGRTETKWRINRAEIVSRLGLSIEKAEEWERVELDTLSDAAMGNLAREVATILKGVLVQRCFVMMPFPPEFDEVFAVIRDAALEAGFTAHLSKTLDRVGDVMKIVRDALNHCDYAIADITGNNANVLYETGFAHALNKPVILIREKGDRLTKDEVKFDIRNEQRIDYVRGEWEPFKKQLIRYLQG